jgi:hypothetical protein
MSFIYLYELRNKLNTLYDLLPFLSPTRNLTFLYHIFEHFSRALVIMYHAGGLEFITTKEGKHKFWDIKFHLLTL